MAVRCASGLMNSEREDGLSQHGYATSYRPPSTATILDSQVEEVIDMELHGAGHVDRDALLECRR